MGRPRPWRRRAASLLACLLCGGLAFPRPAAAGAVPFDIPAGPATETIAAFARQAGIALVFPYELAIERRTRAVQGTLEPEAALRALLRGSGLAARRDANGAIAIVADDASAPRREPQPPAVEPLRPDEAVTSSLDEIVVTGTRLEPNGMASATPVAVLSDSDLRLFGPGSLVDALVQLPHFLNNDTPETQSFGASGAAGASHLNLRGIGSIRTLTLLDGRRVVPSTRFGTIDLALLPRALIERVEVVTGGASAAYGSDAVSGVANLLLDSRFEGLEAAIEGGYSGQKDNATGSWELSYGTPIRERSHLVLSVEGLRAEGIRGYASRPWFRSRAAIGNPDPAGPAEVIVNDAHATGYTYGGLITSGPLAGIQFLPGGTTAPFVPGTYRTSLTQAGGDGEDPAADIIWILPDQERATAFAKLSHEATPALELYLQLLAGRSTSEFGKDPASLWGPWEATLYAGNPFLPEDIRERMLASGLASFTLGRVGAGDLGESRIENRSRLASGTLGFGWDLPSWRVAGYYQLGHNRNEIRYHDTLRLDRVYRAIDAILDPASGRIVCRSTLTHPADGCVPADIFGQGSVSDAARAYVTEGSSSQFQNVDEQVAELSIQGSPLALAAGELRVAGGLSWRSESTDSYPRRYPAELDGLYVHPASEDGYRGLPAAYSGNANIFERTLETTVAGHYAVHEAFAEAALPLLPGRDGSGRLTLHGALRYAHYSGSGSIGAWKAGAEWRAHESVRLRATRSRDVRAGSLAERFDVSNSGVTITDPFIVDPVVMSPVRYAVVGTRVANPDVEPERGDTSTVGVVFQPAAAPAFALSADYFDIRISDAISLLGVQNIIDRCRAGETELCTLISRNADTGRIVRVANEVRNVTAARSRGVDVEAAWRNGVRLFGGAESLAVRLLGNYSLESTVNGVDRVTQTGLGGGAPRWQANLSIAYRRDSLQLSVHEQVIADGIYNIQYGPEDIDDNTVGGVAYTDLRGEWRPRGIDGLTLVAHVTNLFDRSPPAVPDWGFGGSLATNESLFDPVGRRYGVGFRLEL